MPVSKQCSHPDRFTSFTIHIFWGDPSFPPALVWYNLSSKYERWSPTHCPCILHKMYSWRACSRYGLFHCAVRQPENVLHTVNKAVLSADTTPFLEIKSNQGSEAWPRISLFALFQGYELLNPAIDVRATGWALQSIEFTMLNRSRTWKCSSSTRNGREEGYVNYCDHDMELVDRSKLALDLYKKHQTFNAIVVFFIMIYSLVSDRPVDLYIFWSKIIPVC